MTRKWFGIIALISVALTLLNISSCGDPQELVSINIQPGTDTIGASNIPVIQDAGIQVQLEAYGNYIHPPVTKDITNQVSWLSNTPQMFTVNSTGVITATGELCGGTIISASVTTNSDSSGVSSSGAVVTGSMTANVVCSTGTTGGPALTVTFAGAGSGTVLISPLNISCSSLCAYEVPTGTELTLTANPASGSTFGTWQNCNSGSSTNPCTLTIEENTTVTVTFN